MKTDDIKHLASLARIRITDTEADQLKEDVSAVLEYVSAVDAITADAELTKKVGARHNVFRPDVITNTPGGHTDDLLAEAPQRSGPHLKVKKILEQE